MRNVLRQRGRSAFVIGAVTLGVTALVLAGGFIKDTIVELGDSIIFAQTGHLQLSQRGYRDSRSFDPEAYLLSDLDALRGTLERDKRISQVLFRFTSDGLASNGSSDWPVLISGVEPARESVLGSYVNIADGRRLVDNDSYGALLGAGVAEALELVPGDWFDLIATTLDGSMNTLEFQVVGTFQTFSKDYDARAIRIPLEAVQSLVDATGANVAVLELLDTASTHAVALDLQSLYASEGFELYRWDELDPFYDQTVTLYQQQFGFLIAVILLLIVLGVGTAISMSVYERGAEFGTLRALGTHDGSIGMLILLESLYLGTVGASVGVLIGNLLALLISSIGIPMPPPPNSDLSYVALIRSSFLVSLAAFTVGAIAPFLAALAPVRRSLRLSIVAALQRGI